MPGPALCHYFIIRAHWPEQGLQPLWLLLACGLLGRLRHQARQALSKLLASARLFFVAYALSVFWSQVLTLHFWHKAKLLCGQLLARRGQRRSRPYQDVLSTPSDYHHHSYCYYTYYYFRSHFGSRLGTAVERDPLVSVLALYLVKGQDCTAL